MMIENDDIEFWKRFAKSWILIGTEKEISRPDPTKYQYKSIQEELMNFDDDDDID